MQAFGRRVGEADAFHLFIKPGRASVCVAGHGHVKPLRVLLKIAQNLVRRLLQLLPCKSCRHINGSAALHKFQALLKQLPGAPHMGWKEFLNGHIAVVDCIEQRIQPGLSASHMDGHIAAAPGEHTGPSGLGCQ